VSDHVFITKIVLFQKEIIPYTCISLKTTSDE